MNGSFCCVSQSFSNMKLLLFLVGIHGFRLYALSLLSDFLNLDLEYYKATTRILLLLKEGKILINPYKMKLNPNDCYAGLEYLQQFSKMHENYIPEAKHVELKRIIFETKQILLKRNALIDNHRLNLRHYYMIDMWDSFNGTSLITVDLDKLQHLLMNFEKEIETKPFFLSRNLMSLLSIDLFDNALESDLNEMQLSKGNDQMKLDLSKYFPYIHADNQLERLIHCRQLLIWNTYRQNQNLFKKHLKDLRFDNLSINPMHFLRFLIFFSQEKDLLWLFVEFKQKDILNHLKKLSKFEEKLDIFCKLQIDPIQSIQKFKEVPIIQQTGLNEIAVILEFIFFNLKDQGTKNTNQEICKPFIKEIIMVYLNKKKEYHLALKCKTILKGMELIHVR